MEQKDSLWESYEDAQFAILMDAVAEQEGQKGLQLLEELEKDPSAQVPEEVQRKAEKTIRKAFAAKKRDAGLKALRRIAVTVLVTAALVAGIFAVFPGVRAAVLNLVEQTVSNLTGTDSTAGDPDEYASAGFQIQPDWLPDGFALTEEGQNNATVFCTYRNDSNDVIFISENAAQTSMAVDTENATVETIQVQGYEGTLIQKKDFVCILFLVPEKDMVVYIDSEGRPVDEIVKIAENLRVNETI